MASTCSNCKYWQDISRNIDRGYCRRNAPRPAAVSPIGETGNLDGVWPRTSPGDWCGEWSQKVEVEQPLEQQSE